MHLDDLLHRQAVLSRLGAASKRHALTIVGETAAKVYGLNAMETVGALAAREDQASTGFGFGVAIPHARIKGLTQVRAVFAQLEVPLDFQALDEKPVDLVFALFMPERDDAGGLRALARVSRMLRRPEVREQLRQARSADALYVLITREEADLTAAA